MKVEKRALFKRKDDYLGQTILTGNLGAVVEQTKDIRKTPFADDKMKLSSFLGEFNVYQSFLSGLEEKSRPLNVLLKKEAEVYWTDTTVEQLDAFQQMPSAETHRAALLVVLFL